MFSFTSFGKYFGIYLFLNFQEAQGGITNNKIQGQTYHSIGSLLPDDNGAPKYSQMYFFGTDYEQELGERLKILRESADKIQQNLHENNAYDLL